MVLWFLVFWKYIDSPLKYVNDGRPFWKYIVSSSTGCSDSQCFEELYNYYTTDKAWHLCDPDAEKVVEALRKAGVKVAVVSNFDARLRPLLHDLCFVYGGGDGPEALTPPTHTVVQEAMAHCCATSL
ncbi:hypothetical protein ACFX13_024022 [Malus domestica]